MIQHLGRGDYQLSTGRTFYANRGLIGIDSLGVEISEGFDGHIFFEKWDDDLREDVPDWTREEKLELAEEMIARWYKFADNVQRGVI